MPNEEEPWIFSEAPVYEASLLNKTEFTALCECFWVGKGNQQNKIADLE